jgi:8-oxo-dGTP pyrophosphatase MutT (NUDIX family)
MEIWDAYLRDGTPAGRELVRGEPIPEGLYHLTCDILVRHADGEYLLMQRDTQKPNYGGWYETTAGGSALKGENSLTCARRELREETGITCGEWARLGDCIIRDTIYHQYLCVTDQPKNAVTLQPGETIGYRWLSEEAFAAFVNSGEMIPSQRERFRGYLSRMGYLR